MYYHGRNYEQTHTQEKEKIVKKILNKTRRSIEPCGTPDAVI